MRLRSKVVDLIWLRSFENIKYEDGISYISEMKNYGTWIEFAHFH